MKKTTALFLMIFSLVSVLHAQSPQAFKYQAIARDDAGNVLSMWDISLRISLIEEGENGKVVYTETHDIQTNIYGLINLVIGEGEIVTGDIGSIEWGKNRHYIKMEMDIDGGSDFKETGFSQLYAVPYALYAEEAGKITDYSSGAVTTKSSTEVSGVKAAVSGENRTGTPNSKLSADADSWLNANAGNVGIGTTAPEVNLDIRSGATNETSRLLLGNSDNSHNLYFASGRPSRNPMISFKASNALRFTFWDGSLSYELMRIRNDGRVGIGTSTPQSTLEVMGPDTGRITLSAAPGLNSLASELMMKSTFGGTVPDQVPRNLAMLRAHFDGGGWENAALSFYVAGIDCNTDGDIDPCERMRITSGGHVGIGTDDPDESALVDMTASDMGFLPPRMTTSQMSAITAPAEGLTIYNTTLKTLCWYNGTQWICLEDNEICGSPINYAGQTYGTVEIGGQCWMAENLNVGTQIPGTDPQEDDQEIEKYCYNDIAANCDEYGGLYQWGEAMDYSTTSGSSGICPPGWHIPSDSEWTTLSSYLGGTAVAGGKMKEEGTTHWFDPNTDATNESGFTGLGGGILKSGFNSQKVIGIFWTSTYYDWDGYFAVWYRRLFYENGELLKDGEPEFRGLSVRCVRDQ